MMSKILKKGFIGNSVIVGLMTLVSRVTGLVRDIVFAHFLGSNKMADLFLIATRIPNTFRAIFADGAFNNTFIPLFSKVEKEGDAGKLQKFARDIFSLLFYILTIFTVIVLIFMPVLVNAFAGRIQGGEDTFNALVTMCKITFPFLMFVSLTRFFAGILETKSRFALVAFSPAIVNIIGIVGVLIAGHYSLNIAMWAAWAFTIGGIIQAIVLFVATARHGFGIVPYPIKTFYKNFAKIIREKNIKTFTKNIGPGVISGGIYNVNIMVSTFFASAIAGAVSWIYYAERLVQLPLGIIGIAIGTVLLPKMSSAKTGDDAVAYLNRAIKASLFLIVPTAVGLVVVGELIISLIYERGAFTFSDTMAVDKALMILAIGLPFLSLNRYLSILFYSRGDTKTPMQIAFACAILNVFISFFAVREFGYLGVAIASVAITIINFLMLHFNMIAKKIGKIYLSTFIFFVMVLVSAFVMFCVMWAANYSYYDLYDFEKLYFMQKIFLLLKVCIVGGISYFASCGILFASGRVLRKCFKIIFRPKS